MLLSKFKVDSSKFQSALAEMQRFKRNGIGAVLRQQARLLTSDLVKFTPPFDPKSPIASSLQSQRKVGEGAVSRDVNRAQKDIRELKMFQPGTNKNFEKLLRTRNIPGLTLVLQRSGITNAKVFSEATMARHNYERNRRGIVPVRRDRNNYVLDRKATLNQIRREKMAQVGKAKAGWKPAANKFGPRLPNWIRRHYGNGSVTDNSKANLRPYIQVTNNVPYIQSYAQVNRIVQRALDNRARNMRVNIQKLTEAAARRATSRLK